MTIKDYKQIFDAYAAPEIDAMVQRVGVLVPNSDVQEIIAQVGPLFQAGGKRVRPFCLDLAYRTGGGTEDQPIYKVALALELFHLFCLVHDDIIDEAPLRHGATTINTYAGARWNKKIGSDQAILVGDLLLSWSNQLITQALASVSSQIRDNVLGYFYAMCDEVVVGQMLDVHATVIPTMSTELLLQKTLLKTSRYTFVGPAKIGFALAEADRTEFVEAYGSSLGMAFQIQDDVLDIISEEESLQKPIMADAAQQQHTVLTQYLVEKGLGSQLEDLRQSRDFSGLRSLYIQSGAIEYAQALLNEYFVKARASLVLLTNTPQGYIAAWEDLIALIERRVS